VAGAKDVPRAENGGVWTATFQPLLAFAADFDVFAQDGRGLSDADVNEMVGFRRQGALKRSFEGGLINGAEFGGFAGLGWDTPGRWMKVEPAGTELVNVEASRALPGTGVQPVGSFLIDCGRVNAQTSLPVVISALASGQPR